MNEVDDLNGSVDPVVAPTPQGLPINPFASVVALLSRSPTHKFLFLSDLEWRVIPPLVLKQFRLFRNDRAVIGYASWALVSDEVAGRLKAGHTRLRPEDWKSGETACLIDLAAPFGGAERMLKEIRESRSASGPLRTIAELRAEMAKGSEQ